MWKWLDETLQKFEKCFNREIPFGWFVIVVIGLMIKTDNLGVTSIVRALHIDPKWYECLLHFFRSNSWSLDGVQNNWIYIVSKSECLFLVNDKPVLIGDGVKQTKEGRRTPGVKRHHQESENSSKPEYIFGHLFGSIGALIGDESKLFCIPLTATIQNGTHTIQKWGNAAYEEVSHVVRIIKDASIVANILGSSFLLLDAYFLTVPVLEALIAEEKKQGKRLLTIVTKAKISSKAFEFPSTYKGKGRPCKKGIKVKLFTLFNTHANQFKQTDIRTYIRTNIKSYLCKDLLWGDKLYQPIRFVLVNDQDTQFILACTDLKVSPEQIILLYSRRMKIEVTFRSMKQDVGGFFSHFWCKSQPLLQKFIKTSQNQTLVDAVEDKQARSNIYSCLKAIEGYTMFSCIALGFLQLIALKFSSEINSSHVRWLRTKTNIIPSEATVAYFMRNTIFSMFHNRFIFSIMQIIRRRQFSNPCSLCDSSSA